MLKGVLQCEMQGHLNSNLEPYREIEISTEVNTWAITKASIIVTMVCNCIFCFQHDLRD